ncbi:unnamed protein product [Adineta steineri]|uniref:Uncharacterized protein n=1 Tax=Adineta steineri TaxID=433720 RepID=A0A818KGP4_9BILA|nr:unnamed protein product [Adineta steineri]CAF3551400.1 unnamed protein product [Adineta steineri]
MDVYQNAQFQPITLGSLLIELDFITVQDECVCQCYTYSCTTGIFFGNNQTCVLYSAYLWEGQLQLTTDNLSSVFTFSDSNTNNNSNNLPQIIEWLFDGDFNDVYNRYNGNPVANNAITWISPGYAGYGSAVYFQSTNYSLVNHYLNLTATSFTISAWIYMPFINTAPTWSYFYLLSHCQTVVQDKCLHVAVSKGKLLLGFCTDDLVGSTTINTNQWYHVAYTYNRSTSEQKVYLNGYLDGSRVSTGPYIGNPSVMIIGPLPYMSWVTDNNGYIDKIIFVPRIKSNDALLTEATLVAYYPFDNTYLDAGPNQINNLTTINTIFNPNGRFNQALVINSTNSSYLQTTGFYYLGKSNYTYSFSIWICPFTNNGTILQVSSPSGWCVPMIGFDTMGYLTVQTLGESGFYSTSFNNETLPLNVWSHIGMTYSISNGIRLFVNGSLVNKNNLLFDYLASDEMTTITIGTCLQSNQCSINATTIVLSQFQGQIDELKIFARELTNYEIHVLASE